MTRIKFCLCVFQLDLLKIHPLSWRWTEIRLEVLVPTAVPEISCVRTTDWIHHGVRNNSRDLILPKEQSTPAETTHHRDQTMATEIRAIHNPLPIITGTRVMRWNTPTETSMVSSIQLPWQSSRKPELIKPLVICTRNQGYVIKQKSLW